MSDVMKEQLLQFRFRYFAPLGLVRRFVRMLLQAGIPPRVGRQLPQRGSLLSYHPEHGTQWSGGISSQGKEGGGFLTGKGARQTARALAVRNDG